MAKIKKEVPEIWRGPVRISDDKYEIWAAVPRKLGEINKKGQYWLTTDGMRFISSQDASEYLLRLATMTGPTTVQQKQQIVKQIEASTDKPSVTVASAPKVIRRTLEPGTANKAVEGRQVRIQQLLRELEKETRS